MERQEAEIRDALSTRLSLLEPGLELIEVEKYLPNPQGTRGFVDLFAKDSQGKFVLIELKRHAGATREAAHEILKYLEAVKVGLSARDAEVRLFVVSTEWKELLVPFSSLMKRTTCDVKGFLLRVDSSNVPISASVVEPLELTGDRLFAPWHEVNLYETREAMEEGAKSYESSCAAKGITNFVLVIMEAPASLHDRAVEATRAQIELMRESFGDTDAGLTAERAVAGMREYPFLVYFAPLQLTEDACWSAIRSGVTGEDLEEFESYVSDMVSDERLCTLHEKTYEAEPKVKRDYFEIGYPAKFGTRLLDDEGWTIAEVRRYGTLRANTVLQDDAIIADLRGSDGNSSQKFRKDFSPSNRAEVAEIRAGTQRCLKDNPLWRNQIERVLTDFMPTDAGVEGKLAIFNPSNFCLSLYLALSRENGEGYIPDYKLAFFRSGEEHPYEVIFGSMEPNGKSPSFTKLLTDYYQGDGFQFLLNLNWGGYESRDVLISRDLGMTFKTFKADFDGNNRQYWELTEFGWEQCGPVDPTSGIQSFMTSFEPFVQDVCDYYASHWDGVMTSNHRDEVVQFRT